MSWDSLKVKLGAAFAAALGLLYILFRWEQSKRKDAEAKLENAEYEKNDAVLVEKQSRTKEDITAVKKTAEEEKAKTLSPSEMEEWLKKNL